MDAQRFPKSFCQWQGIQISLSAFFMVSAVSCLALNTLLNLEKPNMIEERPLRLPRRYLPLLFGHPLLGFVILASVALSKDGIQPSYIACDGFDPPWIRFFTYAGWDWLIALPGMAFCLSSIIKLKLMQRKVKSAARDTSIRLQRQLSVTLPSPSSDPYEQNNALSISLDEPSSTDEGKSPSVASDHKSINAASSTSSEKLNIIATKNGISQQIMTIQGINSVVWGGVRHVPATPKSPAFSSEIRYKTPEPSIHEQMSHVNNAITRICNLLFTFFLCQLIASITPFCAIARDSVDTGFGTQHAAALSVGFLALLGLLFTPAFQEGILAPFKSCTFRRSHTTP
ncbi:hypothetical protein BT69DRAFT_1276783 [Atractiella rhizophila]|nr:hypothetical protein BT69DRAFT_1276783 [Atractiella rhizophila]